MGGSTCGVYEAAWLSRLHASSAHALYLHVPFCVRKCAYCDFSSVATRKDDPAMGRYLSSLERELEDAADVGLLDACDTAYVGGGTPTLLGVTLLGRLVSLVRKVAPRLVELTVEANPDSLSDEVLATLAEAGATRVSIGVQSLHDAELQALGRVHDAETAEDRVAAAVRSCLDVSCDLMCAIPEQTAESWRDTLRRVVALGVGHVSVYPLQIEEGTPFARSLKGEDPSWNDPDVQAERMEAAAEDLSAAGYARYEVASYALAGKVCRHNQMYWTGRPYLGLGTAASSMLTREAYKRLRDAAPRLPKLPDGVSRVRGIDLMGAPGELELLDVGQAAAEDLMLGMRRSAGVDAGLITHARRALEEGRVEAAFDSLVARGLTIWSDGRLVPTHDGWLLGNELYGALWELAEEEVRTIPVT